jgi:hypothetical protein
MIKPLKKGRGERCPDAAPNCRRAAMRHDSKLAHLVSTFAQRALVLTGVFRPASRFIAEAIDDQSTAAST